MSIDFKVDLDFFEEHGYIVIPSIYSKEDLDPLREEIFKLIDAYDVNNSETGTFASGVATQQNSDEYYLKSGYNVSFFFEEGVIDADGKFDESINKHNAFNKIGHALHDLNPTFEKWSYSPIWRKLANEFFTKQNKEATPAIMESMYLFKSPKIGTQVFPHQDSTFVQTNPDTCVGFWIPLDSAHKDNGCLWIVPGSHKAPLERYFNLDETGKKCSFNVQDYKYDISQAIPVEVAAGSIVIFHGRTVHYSLHNHSKDTRHAISLHMIDTSVEYPKTNWLVRPTHAPFVPIERRSEELYPHQEELYPHQ